MGRTRDQTDQKITGPNVERATSGSFKPPKGPRKAPLSLLFGVETVFWPRAAKKSEKWYRGIVKAAECFMARCHTDEAQRSRRRHAAEDAKSGDKGREREGGGGRRTDTAVDECRNEMIDRMVGYRLD